MLLIDFEGLDSQNDINSLQMNEVNNENNATKLIFIHRRQTKHSIILLLYYYNSVLKILFDFRESLK